MPELPEVETMARRLATHTTGRRILEVQVLDEKQDAGLTQLRDHRIAGVRRVGKQCVFELLGPRRRKVNRYLVVHLRMTGLLYWARRLPEPLPHLRVRMDLDRGMLLYQDLRRFGRLRLVEPEDLSLIQPVGIDPTSDGFTTRVLGQLLTDSRQPIKPWLLRQDRLVGLGNIYASEILFAARIGPDRAARTLTPHEIGRLHQATVQVLRRAIDAAGTTFYAIEAGRRVRGTFREQLAVYGQQGTPCPRCGEPVRRSVQAQRSTYYCGGCQK
jgi:formamidopyrimidine-DNA glycosylase